ncbi:hypothetical protein CONLIGDRAFT_631699 [Coniochaeta ligniaria NRRL 30616]|uniref:Uncharacterized protein n=1 Tax=Coniochaeta ligniaria NRRL 30616 TaxID=1408157 RepID=A0A1J7IQ68_9PEZI|nr:hypothetical protein CONLIGDRAFT_631699 [Coniochaeta ligniaria NRRL 30616]
MESRCDERNKRIELEWLDARNERSSITAQPSLSARATHVIKWCCDIVVIKWSKPQLLTCWESLRGYPMAGDSEIYSP